MISKVRQDNDQNNFEAVGDKAARLVTVYPGAENATIPVSIDPKSTLTILNISITSNVELEITIPSDTKEYELKHRNNGELEISTATGLPTYWTLYPGCAEIAKGLKLSSDLNLYLIGPKSGVIELKLWS